MFRLIRWAVGLVLSFFVVLIILRFLPLSLKSAVLNFVNSFVMPADNHPAVIINQLETNLKTLQQSAASDPNVVKIVESSTTLLNDLKNSISR